MRDMRYVLLCVVMLGTLQGWYIEPTYDGPPPYRHHDYWDR